MPGLNHQNRDMGQWRIYTRAWALVNLNRAQVNAIQHQC